MIDDEEKQLLRKLRKKKQSFNQVLNKKNLDDLELDSVMQDDF
jgi:hypothetical protein